MSFIGEEVSKEILNEGYEEGGMNDVCSKKEYLVRRGYWQGFITGVRKNDMNLNQTISVIVENSPVEKEPPEKPTDPDIT